MPAVSERHNLTKKQFGARLRELRIAAGLTQEALADRLGMKQNSYSNWERGDGSPGIEMLDEIAAALNCTLDDLVKPPKAIPEIKRGRPFSADVEPAEEADPPKRGRGRPKKND